MPTAQPGQLGQPGNPGNLQLLRLPRLPGLRGLGSRRGRGRGGPGRGPLRARMLTRAPSPLGRGVVRRTAGTRAGSEPSSGAASASGTKPTCRHASCAARTSYSLVFHRVSSSTRPPMVFAASASRSWCASSSAGDSAGREPASPCPPAARRARRVPRAACDWPGCRARCAGTCPARSRRSAPSARS